VTLLLMIRDLVLNTAKFKREGNRYS